MGGYCGGAPNTGYFAAQNFFDQIYGVAGVDFGALTVNYVGVASGAVWGGNPSYFLSDFAATYAKFFGPPATFTGTTVAPAVTSSVLTQGQSTVTVTSIAGISDGWVVTGLGIPNNGAPVTVTNIAGLVVTLSQPVTLNGTVPLQFADPVGSYQITAIGATTTQFTVGQFLVGPGISGGSLVTAYNSVTQTLTLSKQVSASGTGVTFITYPTPFAPIAVIQLFINLAQSSVMSARWMDTWYLAVGLYVAHFLTLWMRSETGPNTTAAQIVQSGLQIGMLTSKSVGDVSAGIETIKGFLSEWGDWQLTLYGVQFATYAAAIGSGPVYVGSGVGGAGGYYGGPSFGVI